MLSEDRMQTIYLIYRLWAGIDREMFNHSLQEQNVTQAEMKEFMEAIEVHCSTCKLRFNVLEHNFCYECGKPLPLPLNLLLLDLKDDSQLEADHGKRIHGEHVCQGRNFCVYCGHPR